jgi:hypothetical protein
MDNTQMISLLSTLIGNFGFPIVITSYLLIRFEKRIENLNNTILDLMQVIRDGANK